MDDKLRLETSTDVVAWLAERTRVRNDGGSTLAANAEADQLIRDLRARQAPPDAGGADRRLVERVKGLEKEIAFAETECSVRLPGNTLTERVRAMRLHLAATESRLDAVWLASSKAGGRVTELETALKDAQEELLTARQALDDYHHPGRRLGAEIDAMRDTLQRNAGAMKERLAIALDEAKNAREEVAGARAALGPYGAFPGTLAGAIGEMKTRLEHTAAMFADRLDKALTELDRYHQKPPPAGTPGQ